MSLKVYKEKRNFKKTPEPAGKSTKNKSRKELAFVVQMHKATRLHFDFRLELNGVLKSWAVPKGPSLNPLDQRLAILVEDHPMEYSGFEGIIPKGNYGAGTVMVWDRGTYGPRAPTQSKQEAEKLLKAAFEKGHLTVVLNGEKLKGEFALLRFKNAREKNAWLLVKKRDEHASYRSREITQAASAKTGRSLKEIESEASTKREIWLPKRTTTTEQKKGQIPRRVTPMQPQDAADIPPTWIYEQPIKGYRAIAEVEKGRAHLYSRHLMSFDSKFPKIIKQLEKISESVVLDGEITHDAQYEIFDLLYYKGEDLRQKPLRQRKALLNRLEIFAGPIVLRKVFKKHGPDMIAKDPNSRYVSGTSSSWIKQGRAEKSITPAATLTNLGKIFWPKEKYTKGDLIQYYKEVAPIILPYLKDRPESLNRFPNGIEGKSFYQKDLTGYKPKWLETFRIESHSADRSIDYVLCQDEQSLLYIVNLGCIELNPWLSRIHNLENPDFGIIDLDPDDNPFSEVVRTAQEVHRVLEKKDVPHFCKTSGATGIHIAIPTAAKFTYDEIRLFCEEICEQVHKKLPAFTSTIRNPAKRRGKIYLDFMQNRRGQTLASVYSVRPQPKAPVSTPLGWGELTARLDPAAFTMRTIFRRLEKKGDLWKDLLSASNGLSIETMRSVVHGKGDSNKKT